jgi:hypothetical protein
MGGVCDAIDRQSRCHGIVGTRTGVVVAINRSGRCCASILVETLWKIAAIGRPHPAHLNKIGVCSFILSGGGTSVELCSNADRPPRARECCGGTPKILQVPDFAAKQGLVSTELRPTKVRSSSGVFFATFRRVAEAFPSSLTIARTFRGVR